MFSSLLVCLAFFLNIVYKNNLTVHTVKKTALNYLKCETEQSTQLSVSHIDFNEPAASAENLHKLISFFTNSTKLVVPCVINDD